MTKKRFCTENKNAWSYRKCVRACYDIMVVSNYAQCSLTALQKQLELARQIQRVHCKECLEDLCLAKGRNNSHKMHAWEPTDFVIFDTLYTAVQCLVKVKLRFTGQTSNCVMSYLSGLEQKIFCVKWLDILKKKANRCSMVIFWFVIRIVTTILSHLFNTRNWNEKD